MALFGLTSKFGFTKSNSGKQQTDDFFNLYISRRKDNTLSPKQLKTLSKVEGELDDMVTPDTIKTDHKTVLSTPALQQLQQEVNANDDKAFIKPKEDYDKLYDSMLPKFKATKPRGHPIDNEIKGKTWGDVAQEVAQTEAGNETKRRAFLESLVKDKPDALKGKKAEDELEIGRATPQERETMRKNEKLATKIEKGLKKGKAFYALKDNARYQKEKRQINEEARTIANKSLAKRAIDGLKEQVGISKENKAAITIQAAVRGNKARSEVKKQTLIDEEARNQAKDKGKAGEGSGPPIIPTPPAPSKDDNILLDVPASDVPIAAVKAQFEQFQTLFRETMSYEEFDENYKIWLQTVGTGQRRGGGRKIEPNNVIKWIRKNRLALSGMTKKK